MLERQISKSDDVSVDPPIGETRIVHNALTKKYFRLGLREANFLESLDGLSQDELNRSNCSGFNAEEVSHLITWFQAHALLQGGLEQPANEPRPKSSKVIKFLLTPDLWRLDLADPDKFLNRHISIVHALCSRVAMAIYLFIFLLPIGIMIAFPDAFRQAHIQPPQTVGAIQWLAGYATILLVVALHEFAHAVTCKHFGGKVNNIGLKFFYLQPIVFCDVSDSWRFRDVQEKVLVSAAGIILQILLSSMAIALWFVTKIEVLPYFAVMNAAIALFNLYPFAKLDGYWMLVHILNEPHLRQTSFDEVDRTFRKLIGKAGANPRATRPGLLLFGLANLMAVPFLWGAGLFGIYGVTGRLSNELAIGVVALITIPLLYRFCAASTKYVRTFFVVS